MGSNNLLKDVVMRGQSRKKKAKILQIDNPNKIVESCYVGIGGIDQWITIRGEDYNNPILLFVHGGPGSTYSIFTPLLRSWEKIFTVVQWDQRGAGKTFRKNGKEASGSITFERLTQDGIEVTEYLCKRVGQPKVILIGSSVGSLIGLKMAKQRPDLFWAYVSTDQNAPDLNGRLYILTLDALKKASVSKGVKLVEKMGSIPSEWTRTDYQKRNRFLIKAIRGVPNMITDLILPSLVTSPEHNVNDIFDYFIGLSFSIDHLYKELVPFDFNNIGRSFDLPFFIFQGDTDIITPTELAKDYFDEISAPNKEFVPIKNAGHLACFAQPNQFLDEITERVLPLIIT
ncbi:alpha/beta fold hydrolase [Neobacillus drentensis]|uniref:alpha/beta fold hydrolase n=1 Tax=Neobacillus drentensis TaxID=220684 RepID=UPI00285D6F41|nr:alpha/beta hydrolase [Neobacillus drentensis]MDR7239181.1 pimeloyl-ACP methyl ester carboxylesterase [Neobacillus drentensis]